MQTRIVGEFVQVEDVHNERYKKENIMKKRISILIGIMILVILSIQITYAQNTTNKNCI